MTSCCRTASRSRRMNPSCTSTTRSASTSGPSMCARMEPWRTAASCWTWLQMTRGYPTASRSLSRGTCSAPDRAGYGYAARTARSWGALFSRSCRRTWRGARTAACSSPRRARAFTGCRRRRAGHCSAREELPLEQEENEMTEKTILKTLLPLLPPVTNLNLIVGGCAVAESIRVEYQRNRSDGTGRIHARRRYRLHHLEPSGEAERDLGRSRGRVLRCAYRLND